MRQHQGNKKKHGPIKTYCFRPKVFVSFQFPHGPIKIQRGLNPNSQNPIANQSLFIYVTESVKTKVVLHLQLLQIRRAQSHTQRYSSNPLIHVRACTHTNIYIRLLLCINEFEYLFRVEFDIFKEWGSQERKQGSSQKRIFSLCSKERGNSSLCPKGELLKVKLFLVILFDK